MIYTNEGLLLKCDLEGIVKEVCYNHIHPGINTITNRLFAELLTAGSIRKGLDFLIDIGKNSASFGWELLLKAEYSQEPLYFGGALLNDMILIFGSYSKIDFTRFMANLMMLNSEQINQIRLLEKELRSGKSNAPTDTDLLNEMSRLNNELVGMQRQLSKKNLELDELNQQKNRFLGMAAHDLRSPLGQIMNFAEILLEESGGLSADQLKYLTIIYDLSSSMLRLVSDLLDVTSIEQGKIVLNTTRFDCIRLLEQTVALNKVFAEKKSIQLTLQSELANCEIQGDSGKITQVVNNLLSNAVKFSFPGTVVKVSIKARDENLIIAVTDQGQGIKPEELPKLFQPFNRTATKSTAGEPSTGLGLFIVKKIMEAHGGTVEVSSTTGKGSSFTLKLPMI